MDIHQPMRSPVIEKRHNGFEEKGIYVKTRTDV